MSWHIYSDGTLIERGDDETRAVYDGAGAKIRDYTEAENADADADVTDAARLDDLADRVARIEAHLWPPEPDPTTPTGVPTWEELGGIAPAGALLLDGGRVWRNVAGVPLTAPPSGFVGWTDAQLAHLWALVIGDQPEPDPDPTYPQWRGEWSAEAEYVVGDHITRGGVIYRCLVDHGAAHAGTWGPPAAGVWVAA